MELFIQVKDGKPFEHPIFGDNFKQAFPEIDTENLPPEFARFTRHPMPEIGPYEIYEGVSYEKDESGGYCDVHQVRNMTQQEKEEKINLLKSLFKFPSWEFNEEFCIFVPPKPYPGEGYEWDENKLDWVLSPVTN